MSINTPFNVTLTEGQIGVILCSLENSTKYADSEYIEEVDGIFQILEGAVDKYYDKLEAAKKKQPDMEWQPVKCNPIEYRGIMNRDYMANMLFNINDVVETIKGHSITNNIIEEYDESQFDEEPITLMDIPKDWEGSSITIGDCLLDLQTHINELHDYFSSQEEVQPLKCNPSEYSKIMHNFKEFLDYCESFYSPSHPDVLYPIDGLTRGELALATLSYLDLCAASDGTVSWGDGDSLDRERVRDFVINRRAI